MLILRRKAGETLLIGDDIKVTVMDIYEGSVRLAIDAPKEIPILRSELLQAMDINRAAADGQQSQELLVHITHITHARREIGYPRHNTKNTRKAYSKPIKREVTLKSRESEDSKKLNEPEENS